MSWYHWSPNKIDKIHKCNQTSDFKPEGLYFAKGMQWIEQCEKMGMYPNNYQYCYKLNLNWTKMEKNGKGSAGTRTRNLSVRSEVRYPLRYESWIPHVLLLTLNNTSDFLRQYKNGQLFDRIDWKSVATQYNGVHITQELIDSDLLFSAYDVETLVLWSENIRITLVKETK